MIYGGKDFITERNAFWAKINDFRGKIIDCRGSELESLQEDKSFLTLNYCLLSEE